MAEETDPKRWQTEKKSTPRQYTNSLLAAVGYLDLANALDFPANVWNSNPLPVVAIVLMALGGSTAIVTTSFAFWDMHRSKRNVDLLHEERAYLRTKAKRSGKGLSRVERAWLDTSFREIGWEYIDRILMDASLAIAGVLVGIGCLLAIRGAIPIIFHTSNILSGYLGNSFVALYAVINTPWSVFMWMRGRRHHIAAKQEKRPLCSAVRQRLKLHGHRHQIYAIVNGLTLIVSGVGSLLSAEHWYGYVILIPCVLGSIFCNYYWRLCLGYTRYSIMDRADIDNFDIAERLSIIATIRSAFALGQADETDFLSVIASNCDTVAEQRDAIAKFMHDYALSAKFASHLWLIDDTQGESQPRHENEVERGTFARSFTDREAANAAIRDAGMRPFPDEERFLLELYGCFLCTQENDLSTAAMEKLSNESEEEKKSEGVTTSPKLSISDSPRNQEQG